MMEELLIYAIVFLLFSQLITFFCLFLIFRQFGQVYLSTGESIARDGLALGKKIPSVQAWSLSDHKLVSINNAGNKPTLLVFISPRCKPCEELVEDWNLKYETYKDEVHFCVVFVGEEDEVNTLIEKKIIYGERFWDRNQELFNRFQVRVTPFAFALDDGLIKDKGLCGNAQQIDQMIGTLLVNEQKIVEEEER
ncbi:TlpA family protein disulfide reductase [Salipaludibacillus keqinensis]|nr:thioredoxin fold domain-containing protein [Salipaludibacillus keqinensis]